MKLARAEWPSLVWLWAVSWASPYCQTLACAAGLEVGELELAGQRAGGALVDDQQVEVAVGLEHGVGGQVRVAADWPARRCRRPG